MQDERNAPSVQSAAHGVLPEGTSRPLAGGAHASGPSPEISPVDGFRAALRMLRPLLGDRAIGAASSAMALERMARAVDPPTVAGCTMIEDALPRDILPHVREGVSAFLDGIQRSRVIGHINGSPIIFATVGAVIRERNNRQLRSWHDPLIRHHILAARSHIGDAAWDALEHAHGAPIDIAEQSPHPLAVRTRALDHVADERERLERRLAADWCQREARWLWVDGGISGNLAIDATAPAFGVVKSHSTLYGDAEALRATLGLAIGERSGLFLVQHRSRRAVASWYLRLHVSSDGNPLHGLVRIEVAPPQSLFAPADVHHSAPDPIAVQQLTSRADDISAWVLAERKPVALPDPRWDTLTYGVYACEQFLKSLIGP